MAIESPNAPIIDTTVFVNDIELTDFVRSVDMYLSYYSGTSVYSNASLRLNWDNVDDNATLASKYLDSLKKATTIRINSNTVATLKVKFSNYSITEYSGEQFSTATFNYDVTAVKSQ